MEKSKVIIKEERKESKNIHSSAAFTGENPIAR
jgi:hypothetical protein